MRSIDKDRFGNALSMCLPYREGIGTETFDVAKPSHPFTLTGVPTWSYTATGFPYLDFDGMNDFLTCPAADVGDVDFTTEDFSAAAWIYSTDTWASIFNLGELDTDGWSFEIYDGYLLLYTNTAPSSSVLVAVAAFTLSEWQLVGFTRSGAVGRLYVNGLPIRTTGAATDPTAVAGGNDFYVGAYDMGGFPVVNMTGYLALQRIWERELSQDEMKEMYDRERSWFGV